MVSFYRQAFKTPRQLERERGRKLRGAARRQRYGRKIGARRDVETAQRFPTYLDLMQMKQNQQECFLLTAIILL